MRRKRLRENLLLSSLSLRNQRSHRDSIHSIGAKWNSRTKYKGRLNLGSSLMKSLNSKVPENLSSVNDLVRSLQRRWTHAGKQEKQSPIQSFLLDSFSLRASIQGCTITLHRAKCTSLIQRYLPKKGLLVRKSRSSVLKGWLKSNSRCTVRGADHQ